nr:type II secretion system protein [Alicyclobacillus mali (ex Roth et al. 2021)]
MGGLRVRTFESGRDGHQRRRRAKGFTLIEVLASVVIIVMAGTAALFAVESVQAGQLKEAEYSKALGLATTIAEEIRDRNPNAQIQILEPIIAASLSGGGSSGSSPQSLFQQSLNLTSQLANVLSTALNSVLTNLPSLANMLQQGATFDQVVQAILNFPSTVYSQMLSPSSAPINAMSVSPSMLWPFAVVIPGDALGDASLKNQTATLYIPSPAVLGTPSNSGMTFTEFMLDEALGGKSWSGPYLLPDGYTCTVNAQPVGGSSSSQLAPMWSYTIRVQSPHGAVAQETVTV